MTGFLRQRCLIDPKWTATVRVRGVDWITDRYVMVRADALRTRPKPHPEMSSLKASSIRKIIESARGGALKFEDSGIRLDHKAYAKAPPYPIALLQSRACYVALNAKAAEEWLSHEWASIARGVGPFVEFRQLRRGRPVLVGIVMPVRLSSTAILHTPAEVAA